MRQSHAPGGMWSCSGHDPRSTLRAAVVGSGPVQPRRRHQGRRLPVAGGPAHREPRGERLGRRGGVPAVGALRPVRGRPRRPAAEPAGDAPGQRGARGGDRRRFGGRADRLDERAAARGRRCDLRRRRDVVRHGQLHGRSRARAVGPPRTRQRTAVGRRDQQQRVCRSCARCGAVRPARVVAVRGARRCLAGERAPAVGAVPAGPAQGRSGGGERRPAGSPGGGPAPAARSRPAHDHRCHRGHRRGRHRVVRDPGRLRLPRAGGAFERLRPAARRRRGRGWSARRPDQCPSRPRSRPDRRDAGLRGEPVGDRPDVLGVGDRPCPRREQRGLRRLERAGVSVRQRRSWWPPSSWPWCSRVGRTSRRHGTSWRARAGSRTW